MTVFLFILLLCLSGFSIFYLTNKINTQRRQIMMLVRQNNNLKMQEHSKQVFGNSVDSTKLQISFFNSDFKAGTTSEECTLYAAPMQNNLVLNTIKKGETLKIHGCAEFMGITWYEVSFFSEPSVNNKGWVKAVLVVLVLDDIGL